MPCCEGQVYSVISEEAISRGSCKWRAEEKGEEGALSSGTTKNRVRIKAAGIQSHKKSLLCIFQLPVASPTHSIFSVAVLVCVSTMISINLDLRSSDATPSTSHVSTKVTTSISSAPFFSLVPYRLCFFFPMAIWTPWCKRKIHNIATPQIFPVAPIHGLNVHQFEHHHWPRHWLQKALVKAGKCCQ